MHNLDWSDLRYVLAVATAGSAAGAARALGVNHSTVVRRVRAFEDRLAIRIFDHLASGYRLTEQGEMFLDAARSIDGVVGELSRKMAGGDDELAGNVRITTTDSLSLLLFDALAGFRRGHPKVTLDVLVTNTQLNLDAIDADVAVRPTREPPDQLVGRRICDIAFCIYGSASLAREFGDRPVDALPCIGLGGPLAASGIGRSLEESALTGPPVMRCDSFNSLLTLAESGAGCAVLPCFLGDASPLVRRLCPEPLEFRNQLWLLHHRDVLRSWRVKTVAEFLVESLRARRPLLEGETTDAGANDSAPADAPDPGPRA